MTKAEDMFYMERALSLAEKGAGKYDIKFQKLSLK